MDNNKANIMRVQTPDNLNNVFSVNRFNSLPGLERVCIDRVSEAKLCSLNAFIAWVLCSENLTQGHCGLEELWTRVSSP